MEQTRIDRSFSEDFIAMCQALGYEPDDVMNNEAKYLIVIEYLLM
jgi:antitoxin component of RelBE/YafQ-DinJ toxin-antitoxin module